MSISASYQIASVSDTLYVWTFTAGNDLSLRSTYKPSLVTNDGSTLRENFNSLSWNHTNQVIAIAGSLPKVSLIQANNGQLLSTLQLSESLPTSIEYNQSPLKLRNSSVSSLSFSNNSRYLAASLNNTIQYWDLKRRQLKTIYHGHTSSVSSLCFLPNGDVIAGDTSGIVRIWDSKSSECSDILISENIPNKSDITYGNAVAGVTCVQLSPVNPSYLSAGFSDGSLCTWDLSRNDKAMKKIPNINVGSINAISYSPKNWKLLSTAGKDGKLSLVDTTGLII